MPVQMDASKIVPGAAVVVIIQDNDGEEPLSMGPGMVERCEGETATVRLETGSAGRFAFKHLHEPES